MTKPAPGLTISEQPIAVLLRMCLWAEARGEGCRGMAAVRWCLENRRKRFGWPMNRVILQPWHFSSFNEGDPNRPKLLTAWQDDPHHWGWADAVCNLFDDNLLVNEIGDSSHYYNASVAQPKWGRGHAGWNEVAVVGRHVFGIAA